MKKPKSVYQAVQGDVWSAHISKATSSPHYAKEYKRSNYVLDTLAINARRIKNGEAVGASFLKGKVKEQLLAETDLTESDFKKYFD
jgi:hypothetical protein